MTASEIKTLLKRNPIKLVLDSGDHIELPHREFIVSISDDGLMLVVFDATGNFHFVDTKHLVSVVIAGDSAA